MRFILFLEGRVTMGIVSPEGKIYNLPGASELNMIDYLRVNHIVDNQITFGRLLVTGWVFYTDLNDEINVTYKRSSDTTNLINHTFRKMKFGEIHFDDPWNRSYFFMKYDEFMKKGI